MNKLVLPVLGLLFLSGVVSAYQIDIDAPATLTAGKPLIVNGTTNFGIGTPIDVVLYRQLTSSTELKRKIAYVQSDHTFRVVFDTTNLEKGTYKVEVPASGLGDSINMRIVELVDRTDEISLDAGTVQQEFSGTLQIAGTMADNRNSGVQIEVTGPTNQRIFGPKFVPTNYDGSFVLDLPIDEGGEYEVSFTDTRGYIGTRTITVTGGTGALSGTTPVTTAPVRFSSRARASREAPAYFEVRSGSGLMNISTSANFDWVIEYGDDRKIIRTLNEKGAGDPERVTIAGNGKSVYFKVYPSQDSDEGEVILFAENAESIRVSPGIPAIFENEETAAGSSTQAPLGPLGACSALLAIIVLLRNP